MNLIIWIFGPIVLFLLWDIFMPKLPPASEIWKSRDDKGTDGTKSDADKASPGDSP
jgi:hypothetical protein